jgi:hypothetical protein
MWICIDLSTLAYLLKLCSYAYIALHVLFNHKGSSGPPWALAHGRARRSGGRAGRLVRPSGRVGRAGGRVGRAGRLGLSGRSVGSFLVRHFAANLHQILENKMA